MMILRLTLILLFVQSSQFGYVQEVPSQYDRSFNEAKITRIINQWHPPQAGNHDSFSELRELQHELLDIADQSPESRQNVIAALLKTLEGSEIKYTHYKLLLYLVCDSLGELKATEAIDILAALLDLPQDIGGLSINNRPVVLALTKIGQPAVSKLQEVILNSDLSVIARKHAVEALIYIEGTPARRVLRKALRFERDEGMVTYVRAYMEWLARCVNHPANRLG